MISDASTPRSNSPLVLTSPPASSVRRTTTARSLPARMEDADVFVQPTPVQGYAPRPYAPAAALRAPSPSGRLSTGDAVVNVSLEALQREIAALRALPPEGRWDRAAHRVSDVTGTSYAFFAAVGSGVGLGLLGIAMHGSDTWLIIMSIVPSMAAFLMLFVLAPRQNQSDRERDFRHNEMELRLVHLQHEMADLRSDVARLLEMTSRAQEPARDGA